MFVWCCISPSRRSCLDLELFLPSHPGNSGKPGKNPPFGPPAWCPIFTESAAVPVSSSQCMSPLRTMLSMSP